MRAVVIYESMYGNTRAIAEAIGRGLGTAGTVQVVPVAEATPELLAGAEFVVVGGPTHVHGMSRPTSRHAAVADAAKSSLPLEPNADGPGLREWFAPLGRIPGRAAAFDTRLKAPGVVTGRASKGISRNLRRHGFDVVADPESFFVSKQNAVLPGEAERAEAWGAELAARTALLAPRPMGR